MAGHPRPIDGVRPEVGSGVARAQPSSIPILADAPTIDELPTDEQDEPVGVLYLNHSTSSVEVAVPDGTGSVVTDVVSDLSASLSLDAGDLTGLL